ncbi:unnamed protein product [Onchocerca flexuosa]|uniref:Uncharacterized protein n=1 Tax=Onchocerca flexuosa TaxID=387005 RepID=A0A183HVH3_9BILA|nr:unnamed protein product [Onchocerca flexuosa]
MLHRWNDVTHYCKAVLIGNNLVYLSLVFFFY